MAEIEQKIRQISEHYSKKSQWKKTIEEVEELMDELEGAGNPFGYPDMVNFSGNMWSKCADVIIMIAQLAMQHGKEKEVREQIEFKVDRQLKRMQEDR